MARKTVYIRPGTFYYIQGGQKINIDTLEELFKCGLPATCTPTPTPSSTPPAPTPTPTPTPTPSTSTP